MKKRLLFLFIPFISFAQWTQVGGDIDGEFANDQSGRKTCINGDGSIVAIGATQNSSAAGQVRIFENVSGTWTQVGDDIIGESNAHNSGKSLDINDDGSIVAIGAQLFGEYGVSISIGHVRVYQNISENWIQIGNDIIGDSNGDQLGQSVSINGNGNVVAVSATNNYNGLINTGYVKIFEFVSNDWIQIGETIYGEFPGGLAKSSISLNNDGSIIAIGAPNNNESGLSAGSVRVFQNISGTWTQIGDDIDGEAAGDNSGISVSLNNPGNILAVGAYLNDGNGHNSGHVRVFENISGSWVQIGNDIDGEAEDDASGESVSLNAEGNILAVGASTNDGNGFNSGHARIYQNNSGQWQQIDNDIDGESAGDGSGISVSLNDTGNIVAIGAWVNDDNGNNSGHVRVFNNQLLGVDEQNLSNLVLYPNPTNGLTFIKLEDASNNLKLNMYNMLGQNVMTKTFSQTNTIQFNTGDLSKGVYVVNLSTENEEIDLKLIVN